MQSCLWIQMLCYIPPTLYLFVRGYNRDVSVQWSIINNTLDSHLWDSGRFLTTSPMPKQKGAALYSNACEPSSVKPSNSFMDLEEDEITAANMPLILCMCGFVIIRWCFFMLCSISRYHTTTTVYIIFSPWMFHTEFANCNIQHLGSDVNFLTKNLKTKAHIHTVCEIRI